MTGEVLWFTNDRVINHPQAVALWTQVAKLEKHPIAQFKLWQIYRRGLGGGKQDPAKALPWLTQATPKGYAPAQAALGDAYAVGQGVALDPKQAKTWYEENPPVAD